MLQVMTEPVEKAAEGFISEEKGVKTVKEAIDGAKDILAERISDSADYRTYIRNTTRKPGNRSVSGQGREGRICLRDVLPVRRADQKGSRTQDSGVKPWRGRKIPDCEDRSAGRTDYPVSGRKVLTKDNPYTTPVLKEVIADSYSRLIAPSIEREIRNEMTERAEEGAPLRYLARIWSSFSSAANRRPCGPGLGPGVPYRL